MARKVACLATPDFFVHKFLLLNEIFVQITVILKKLFFCQLYRLSKLWFLVELNLFLDEDFRVCVSFLLLFKPSLTYCFRMCRLIHSVLYAQCNQISLIDKIRSFAEKKLWSTGGTYGKVKEQQTMLLFPKKTGKELSKFLKFKEQ